MVSTRSTPWSSTGCTRSTPTPAPTRCEHARAELATDPDEAAARLAARYANLADFEEVAAAGTRASSPGLEQRIGDASVSHVPELGHDVHDFAALRAVGSHLLAAD